MNKQRREDLNDVIQLIDDAIDRLIEIREEEQDAFDNLPESFQDSDRGGKMLDAMDAMDAIESDLEDVKSSIDDLIAG